MDETAITSNSEHFDVLIVGAGISGIGGAYHLQTECPNKRYVILETQESFGGTWLTHKYPGIRSDSDLFTFGYKFKPWVGPPIATGSEIRSYMDEIIKDNKIDDHIRYQHKIKRASWSTENALWTLEANRKDTGEPISFTCNFLWMCQGYYCHSKGYTPNWQGVDKYQGQIIHPQSWPEDLDYKDKKVLVIGSGATAATVIPAMAEDAEHVTMLQRSPTYFLAAPNSNETADMLRELDIPDAWTHEIVRQKILLEQKNIVTMSFEQPEFLKNELLSVAREHLGPDFDVEKHFTPSYRPWRQRLALLPNGDLFKDIAAGKASVVTDEIVSFTEKGVLLKSGEELEADIILTATGFNLSVLGDISFTIDGKALDFSKSITYRGIMYTDIPNMAWVFGYLRTSWTMRSDLISEFVCRLLKHMDAKNLSIVTPELSAVESTMTLKPFVDDDNFNAGYLKRKMDIMPKQLAIEPWTFKQDYDLEKIEIPAANLDDGALKFS